jgi:hypothetical protein
MKFVGLGYHDEKRWEAMSEFKARIAARSQP